MILNNTIIITLQDFQRHFSFPQFWARRKHFIRDMNPSRVYYVEDTQKEAYRTVCNWISAEETNITNEILRNDGLNALSELAGKEITQKDLSSVLVTLNYTDDIIVVPSGKSINLPGKLAKEEDTPSDQEQLHKIEVHGDGDSTNIHIGGDLAITLQPGEFVYVTELNGMFVRVLPTKGQRGFFRLRLENVKGVFESTLHAVLSGFGSEEEQIFPSVTQFWFTNGNFKYSNSKYLNC